MDGQKLDKNESGQGQSQSNLGGTKKSKKDVTPNQSNFGGKDHPSENHLTVNHPSQHDIWRDSHKILLFYTTYS